MALFIIVAPIFALILLGWVARRFGLVKESAVDVLTGFVYYIALPALIVQSLLSIQWDANSFFCISDDERFAACNVRNRICRAFGVCER